MPDKPRVVIIGAGFAGLWAAQTLARQPVSVTLVDANNFHTFLPLLYQVATAGIEPEEIAYPVRGLLRSTPNVQFRLASIKEIDPEKRVLKTADGSTIPYDFLILASGSATRFYGIPGAEECAFSLKSIDEAIQLRNHIISCLEAAAYETDPARRRALLTFVVVGGGATGVEFTGSLAELMRGPVRKDYPGLAAGEIRLILVEAGERLLPGFPERLSAYTLRRLQKMGVEVQLRCAVAEVSEQTLVPASGPPLETRTVVWMAGIAARAPASPFPPARPGDRFAVEPTLQVKNQDRIFAAGDLAGFLNNGRPLPAVAPVAIQQGITAAKNILRLAENQPVRPFSYFDKGSMVTIGRNAAVVAIGKLTFTGFPAWILWLGLHLYQLIGFRNRLLVLINWAWDYIFVDRAVRLILPSARYRCRPFARGCAKENPS